MNTRDAAKTVIETSFRHYFSKSERQIVSLGSAGGFSGARFWKIFDGDNFFCLRRWPIEVSRDEPRLAWIHRQLDTARSAGCDFLPIPLPSNDCETLVEHGDHLWQLEAWMPGQANYRDAPSETKLVAAMEALAQFHTAVRKQPYRKEVSPGILLRAKRLSQLYDGNMPTNRFLQIESAAADDHLNLDIRESAARICMRFRTLADSVQKQLNSAQTEPVEIQTIIGDIWHDHVLFIDDRVTGIVDFGAMRMDTPLADLARLLGSLSGDSHDLPVAGMNAYQAATPNIEWQDTRLINTFDSSTTLIAGMNWLQWLCVEDRDFGDLNPVSMRLQRIARRLDFLASCL